jgi:two-component system cell cycle sensor histidine kinase/response regulator CckA
VIRVLIIDTDHAHARSVEKIVRRHLGDGVRTTVATSTAGAIPLIEAGEFDVALVDSGAHDTRGLELIQRGLVLHPRRAFIFMTASQDGGLPLLALQAGAVDVLDKTDLTTDTLLRSLRHAVHRSTARSALVEACDRYRTHFMNSGVAKWQSSVDGRLLDVNPAAAVMLGYENIAQLLAVNTAALHVEQEEHRAFGLELERNGRVTNQERRLKRRDGSVIWCLVNAVVTRAAGRPSTIDCTLQDLTDRRFLQAQLRQAQKMEAIGQLAGGVAHDFNNLLTAILGYCDLVLADLPAASRMAGDVGQIQAAGERARDLTQQLLAFSRKQVIHPHVVNIRSALTRFDGLVPRLLGEHIQVTTQVSPDLGNVLIDPSQLEQILMNLAVNASDAMPEGGRLAIETRNVEIDAEYACLHPCCVPIGPYVMVAVSDTGSGMSTQVMAHAFEPFFTTKPVGKGTGLGLSTVYGIVKQSNGYIWIYSEEGHGTTFKIYFPRVTAQERPPELPPKELDGRGTEIVLLVEDEDAVRVLAEVVLARNGYQVITARTAAEAIGIASTPGRKLDVLVTDVMMPNMSGPQLARTLRELRPDLNVLFMSGYTANAIVDQGLLQPGAPFLSKPFSPASLALAVRSLLDGHPDNEIPERSGPGKAGAPGARSVRAGVEASGRSRPGRQVKELETRTGQ